MKLGQKIVIFIIVLLVVLMVFIMTNQTTSKSSKESISAENSVNKNTFVEKNVTKNVSLIDDNELKIVKDLQAGVQSSQTKSSKLYLISCAPCHGKDGKGIIAPPINGQDKEYILKQLKAYKDNEIPNTLMKGIFTNVNDKTLEDLAVEISKFPK